MSYPLYSRLQAFTGEEGQLLAGGELRFFELDTTTPKAVYADYELTDTNGSTVDLDASGRVNEGVFGSGGYFVELYDSAGVKQGEDEVYDPAGSAPAIPIPNQGEFVTGDGTQFLLEDLTSRLVPDSTGQAGKVLGNDGDLPLWEVGPDDPEPPAEPDIVIGENFIRIGTTGDPTKFLKQWGTGTAPATTNLDSSVSISFGTAFDDIKGVEICPTVAGVSSLTPPGQPSWGVTGYTVGSAASGCTVNFRIATDSGGGSSNNINNPVPFVWFAWGFVEVED